jgi:hypothetical protein
MNRILIFLLLSCTRLYGQVPFFAAGGVAKTFDFFSPNGAAGASVHLKASRIYLNGDYYITHSLRNKYQQVASVQGFAAKVGYMKGLSNDNKIHAGGLTFGYADGTYNKKLSFKYDKLPEDEFGNTLDIEYAVVPVRTQVASAGFTFLLYEVKENKYLEAIADEYDLEKIGKKERRSFTTLALDFLYAPVISYEKKFSYTPFANYVPVQAVITDEPKVKRFGVRFHVETLTFAGFGFSLEMGLQPGLALSSDNVNDFGFNTRMGILYHLYYAK